MRTKIIEILKIFKGLFCTKTNTFLISFNFTTISGKQGFGSTEITIKDSNLRHKYLSPVLELIKKENSFETVVVLNIIKL